ncbi:membrane-associated transporter protein-like [Diadema setosum]|uniref:membrane-associated transporter protein-like n=1 Tax=Diadema setosum TaxID=31175 RepID=UPI003B3BD8C7
MDQLENQGASCGGDRGVATSSTTTMSSQKQGPATSSSSHPKRSFRQLVQFNAIQFGIDFSYATETAVVTPILLKLGLSTKFYGVSWLLAPLLGCVLMPIIGPASDRCRSSWGRRRPFILLFGVGVIVGVVLYLNGGDIGEVISNNYQDMLWSIVLTVIGVVLVEFCAGISDIPCRAYLIDVCNYDDTNTALNIRVVFAGLGGSMGYIFTAIDWMALPIGRALGSQLRVICLFNVTFYTLGLILSLCSIPETPLKSRKHSTSSSSSSSSSSTLSPTSVSSTSLCCCLHSETDTVHSDAYHGDDPEAEYSNHGYIGPNDVGATAGEFGRGHSDQHQTELEDVVTNASDRCLLLPDQAHSISCDFPRGVRPTRRKTKSFRKGDKKRLKRDGPLPESCHVQLPPSSERSAENAHTVNEVQQTNQSYNGVNNDLSNDCNDNPILDNPVHVNEASSTVYGKDKLVEDGENCTGHLHGNKVHGGTQACQDIQDCEHDSIREDEGLSAHQKDIDSTTRTENRLQSDSEPTTRTRMSKPTSSSPDDGKTMNVKDLLKSFIFMPCVLRRLLLNHYFSWVAMMTVMLFFTDYMGQAVYHGDPDAPANSSALERYNKGVQMGCWGLCIYSSTAVFVGLLLSYVDKMVSLRTIYVFGQLIFAVGCGALVIFVDNVYATMSLCVTFGINYAVILKIPTNILTKYHESPKFTHPPGGIVRGLATDCGVVGWQPLIAEITASTVVGPLINATGTHLTIVTFASLTGFVSSLLSACFISYEIR